MSRAEETEQMAVRLRAAARDDGLIETAQVKLVGLDEVRAAAGHRWPRMREYVREGSLKIIAERIGPDDAVIPCGDGYLVVFAHAESDQAQERCAAIHDALIAFYLGEETLGALRAEVRKEVLSAANIAGLVSGAAADAAAHKNLQVGWFWPVWSAQRMAVSAYLCGPSLETPGGPRIGYTDGFAETGESSDDHFDLDLCLLEQAIAAANTTPQGLIGVTVHASTMQSRKTRVAYTRHMAQYAPDSNQRMFISIMEIGVGTPLISLTEWVSVFRLQFPRVMLDLHRDDRALGAIRSTGAWAAGFTLPHIKRPGSLEARRALKTIGDWSTALGRQRMPTFIHGFSDAGLLDLATCRGLGFATGGVIGDAEKTPGRLRIATKTRSVWEARQ